MRKRFELEDDEILFGGKETFVSQEEKRKINKNIDFQEVSEDIVKSVDLKAFKLAITIVLIIGLFVSLITFRIGNMFMFVLAIVGFFVIGRKNKNYIYGPIENYYTSNLSITLKGFFNNVFNIKSFMPFANQIGWIAVAILFIEQIVLKNFLFYPISTGIAGLGLLLYSLSIMMLIANKDTKSLSVLLALFAFVSVTASAVTSVLFGYISGQNFILAFVSLLFADWFSYFNIYKVDVEELEQAFEEVNNKKYGQRKDVEKTKEEIDTTYDDDDEIDIFGNNQEIDYNQEIKIE